MYLNFIVLVLCISWVLCEHKSSAYHLTSGGWSNKRNQPRGGLKSRRLVKSTFSLSGSPVSISSLSGGAKAVIDIHSESDFEKALKDAGKKLVVVDFTASWCGPCKSIAPIYQEIAAGEKGVVFLKVDVDNVPEVATKYKVNSMPTFIFIKNSKIVDRFSGASKDKLLRTISSLK